MRRRPRTDANQAVIVEDLRKVGAAVVILSALGDGVPDLLVCYRDRLYLLEVKTARGRFTPAQIDCQYWRLVRVVRTVDEALAAIGVKTR